MPVYQASQWSDGVEREPLGEFEVGADRVGDREQPGLGVSLEGDAEHLGASASPPSIRWIVVHAEPIARSRSAIMKLQTAGRIEPHCDARRTPGLRRGGPRCTGSEQHRRTVEVLGEVDGRLGDAIRLLVAQVTGLVLIRPRHCGVLGEVAGVDVGDRLLLGGVLDDHELPALAVRAGRCLQGDLETLLDDGDARPADRSRAVCGPIGSW